MTLLANGRVVLWQGGNLWVLHVPEPPPGALQRTDFHARHAIQVAFTLDGNFLPGRPRMVADVLHVRRPGHCRLPRPRGPALQTP